jgi:acyl carrier protein
MATAAIEEQVRQYVLDAFLHDTPADAFHNSDDLFALLDSLQVLRLVVQLEKLFGVKVTDSDLTAENLSSVERVARFVERRCVATAAAVPCVPLTPAAQESLSGSERGHGCPSSE